MEGIDIDALLKNYKEQSVNSIEDVLIPLEDDKTEVKKLGSVLKKKKLEQESSERRCKFLNPIVQVICKLIIYKLIRVSRHW